MARTSKKTTKGSVKRAADRAERRSKGEEPVPEATVLDPIEVVSVFLEKPKTGRPSSYKPEYAKQAAKLCTFGATDAELAFFFEVSISTISQWKIQHPEFLKANVRAKEHSDDRVEHSLYQRAVGYEYDAVKIFMPAGASEPVYAPYKEFVPPDVTAALKWLHNRRPEKWREINKHEVGAPGDFARASDEELNEIIASEVKELAKVLPKGNTKH